MNKTIKQLELTGEQLEAVVGGAEPANVTSSISNINSANADQYNILLGSWMDTKIGGSYIQQVNSSVQTVSVTTPQPRKTPWLW